MLLTSPISFPNLGITVDPSPVAFTVMGKDIYWYGIIIAEIGRAHDSSHTSYEDRSRMPSSA